jgi:single-strand DNA-binding protein
MSDIITLTGLIATTPRHLTTAEKLPITSFRLASTQRRYDRSKEQWIDGDTNWYTITTFRQLALNAANSLKKGERVVVTGRLRIREWQTEEKTGTTVDIEADALGHDLSWGRADFTRSVSTTPVDAPAVEEHAPAPDADDSAVAPEEAAREHSESQPLATAPF